MNGRADSEPKLIFPGLAGFYASVSDLWYPMIRVVAGGLLLYHGWGKLMGGVTPVAAGFAKNGFEPNLVWAYVAIFLETAGAIAIMLGLFTRFFAAILAVEMAIIAFGVQMARGFPQMELFLLWGIVFFAIALRGGGPYSLDRVIGKHL